MLTFRAVGPDEDKKKMAEQKLKRMNINVKPSLHDAFKAATAAHGDNMTDVLLEFIRNYVAKNGLASPKKARHK